MTTPDHPPDASVVNACLMVADLLHGLAGLPEPFVTVGRGGTVGIQFHKSTGDEHTRTFAVDAVASLLRLTTEQTTIDGRPWYRAVGHAGPFFVEVYAPDATVIRPEVLT